MFAKLSAFRDEDFITSHSCRAGILLAFEQPRWLSHVIEFPFLTIALICSPTSDFWTVLRFTEYSSLKGLQRLG
jgi:hypothetical protein